MKRTITAGLPWLAAMCLCWSTMVVAADGQPQDEQEKESVDEVIEKVIQAADDSPSESPEVVEFDAEQDEKQQKKIRVLRKRDGDDDEDEKVIQVRVEADGDDELDDDAKKQVRRIIRRKGSDGEENVEVEVRAIAGQDGKPHAHGKHNVRVEVIGGDGDKDGVSRVIKRVLKDHKAAGDVAVDVEAFVVQDDDSVEKGKVKGKIRIKGPDGKVREIDLSKHGMKGEHQILMLDGNKLKARAIDAGEFDFDVVGDGAAIRVRGGDEAAPRFRIGVHCESVDDALRAHIDLPEGALIVRDLVDDSPAVAAGVQQYDILLAAGDSELESVEDLVEQIQKTEGEELTLVVMRRGEKTEVTVKPEKSAANQAHRVIRNKVMKKWMDSNGMKFDFKFDDDATHDLMIQAIKPGIVIDKDVVHGEVLKNLPVLIDRARGKGKAEYRIRRIHKDEDHEHHEGRHEHDEGDDEGDEGDDDEDDETEELEERMQELPREIRKIQRALKELESRRR